MSKYKYTGGCLCGHIRYEVFGFPMFPHFCSCKMCQKWGGSPTVAWVNFLRENLVFEEAEPSLYRSSQATQRGFCPKCGSTILAIDDGSEEVGLTISTLDDSSAITPEAHTYSEFRPSWLKLKQ